MRFNSIFKKLRKKWRGSISYHKGVAVDAQKELDKYPNSETKYWTLNRFFQACLFSVIIIIPALVRRKADGLDFTLDWKWYVLGIILFKTIYFALWFFKLAGIVDRNKFK